MIECPNSRGEGSSQEVFTGQTRNLKNVIDIRPQIVIENCLPVPRNYTTGSDAGNYKVLGTSETGCPEDLKTSMLMMKIVDWWDTDLKCDKILDDGMAELELWRFDTVNPALARSRSTWASRRTRYKKSFY